MCDLKFDEIFHTVTWDFFWGGFVEFFWGEEKTCSPPNLGDKNQKLPSVVMVISMGKILGQISQAWSSCSSRRLGVTIYDDGSWIHRDKSMGFFAFLKILKNSMTFVWVFKDDATLDVM